MNKTFTIKLDADWFKKNDILETTNGCKVKIIKIYKKRWYHSVLLWLGFKIKIFKGVLVKNV